MTRFADGRHMDTARGNILAGTAHLIQYANSRAIRMMSSNQNEVQFLLTCRSISAPAHLRLRPRRRRVGASLRAAQRAAHRQLSVPTLVPRPRRAGLPAGAADGAVAARLHRSPPRHPGQRDPPPSRQPPRPRPAQNRQRALHPGTARPAPPPRDGLRRRPRGAAFRPPPPRARAAATAAAAAAAAVTTAPLKPPSAQECFRIAPPLARTSGAVRRRPRRRRISEPSAPPRRSRCRATSAPSTPRTGITAYAHRAHTHALTHARARAPTSTDTSPRTRVCARTSRTLARADLRHCLRPPPPPPPSAAAAGSAEAASRPRYSAAPPRCAPGHESHVPRP